MHSTPTVRSLLPESVSTEAADVGRASRASRASHRRRSDRTPDDPQRLRSALWVRFFGTVLRRNLQQSFHAVRVARPGLPAVPAGLPLIVYSNHPSWWDAALVPVLMLRLFPARRGYGPIDAEALQRYGFMRRLGLFGVQADSYAGAATFMRVGRKLLAQSDTMFCLTPEGRFVDPRQRPVTLRPGLAGLISRVPRVTVLPLALEYPFWGERTPEALVRFGEPLAMGIESGMPTWQSPEDIRLVLEDRLTQAMDALADDATSRDPGRFQTAFEGRSGVGGIYDVWRRMKAWRRGESFDPSHLRSAPEKRP